MPFSRSGSEDLTFIPDLSVYRMGEAVSITSDITSDEGLFTEGHLFKVTELATIGVYSVGLRDEDGNVLWTTPDKLKREAPRHISYVMP